MHPSSSARPDPSYREVCSGRTGFVEVLDVELADNRYVNRVSKHSTQYIYPGSVCMPTQLMTLSSLSLCLSVIFMCYDSNPHLYHHTSCI